MISIGKVNITKNSQPKIIAEIGINHNGDINKAIDIAKKAIDCGADIIKHQTHIVDDEYSYHAKKVKPGNSHLSIYQIMKKCSLSEEHEFKLMEYVKKRGKTFISTPFSKKAVDRLIKFNVPAFKIGSGECNNLPLVEYISKFKKPIILSTGMNNIASIKRTTNIIRKKNCKFAILHCTNIYPAPSKTLRLNCIPLLKKKFKNVPIGYSDHSESIYACIAAIALGAVIIEKHFIDNKKKTGPDISASMDGEDLKILKSSINLLNNAFKANKELIREERITSRFAFASFVALRDIKKNEMFTQDNVWPKRPGTGEVLAYDYKRLFNKKSRVNIKKDEQIKKKFIK